MKDLAFSLRIIGVAWQINAVGDPDRDPSHARASGAHPVEQDIDLYVKEESTEGIHCLAKSSSINAHPPVTDPTPFCHATNQNPLMNLQKSDEMIPHTECHTELHEMLYREKQQIEQRLRAIDAALANGNHVEPLVANGRRRAH